ncbi:MAG: hypothetical protein MSG64_06460 [Pyrinomonadaceae bacterium MAG19_C2-C3]|nr:hypothetical protein [Pyrinomonadaceae bacterium MAG19_C2-C3]
MKFIIMLIAIAVYAFGVYADVKSSIGWKEANRWFRDENKKYLAKKNVIVSAIIGLGFALFVFTPSVYYVFGAAVLVLVGVGRYFRARKNYQLQRDGLATRS